MGTTEQNVTVAGAVNLTAEEQHERDHARRLAERYRRGFINLREQRIDPELFRTIPADLMFRYNFVPLEVQNNALMIYATPREQDAIMAMLHKIDIVPLQVRIDATIAEVTLNDVLQYGTQWFFKSGGINGILSAATGSLGPAGLAEVFNYESRPA